MKNLFPAMFLIVFMAVSVVMAGLYMPAAISKTENPTWKNIMVGTWAPDFEKSLNESFPIFEHIRNFWGRFEYQVFGEGRKGVLIGQDGWLFTDEEFSCIPGGAENMQENLSYVSEVRDALQVKGVRLKVVLIPAKARVYQDYLGKYAAPSCRKNLYADIISYFNGNAIPVVSLLESFQGAQNRDDLFLKTDTHWTTQGAQAASVLVSAQIDTSGFSSKNFISRSGEVKSHDGDLLRYMPGVENDIIQPDSLIPFETEEEKSDGEADAALALFGDSSVPVTLVGTSYSANPAWNFYGFLKDALDVDILNMADEGLGPFAVMKTYLSSDAWENTPPSLVIWEIPERYITVVPSDIKKGA